MPETDHQFVTLRRSRGPGGDVAFGAAFFVFCAMFAFLFLCLGLFAAAYWWPLGLCPLTGAALLGLFAMHLLYGVAIGARDVMTAPVVTVTASRERIRAGEAFVIRWRIAERREMVSRIALDFYCLRERPELPPPDRVETVYDAKLANVTKLDQLRAGEVVVDVPGALPATGSSADGIVSWSVSVTLELRRGRRELFAAYAVVVDPADTKHGGTAGTSVGPPSSPNPSSEQ